MEQNKEALHEIRIYGLVTVAVVALVVAIVVVSQVRTIVMRSAASVVASGSASLVQGSIDSGSDDLLSEIGAGKLRSLVADRRTGQNLIGFRVINPKGIVVFSTDEAEEGTSAIDDQRDLKALDGALEFTVVEPDDDPIMTGARERALKVYAPLRAGAGQKTVAVIETYKPYSQVATSARDATLLVLVPILVGAMVSSAGLLWVIRRAASEVAHRDAEVASLNARLHDSMLSLEGQSLGTLQALSAAVDEKDAYTARHSLGVTNWAHLIGVAANLTPVEQATLERAGLLHDIGKIGVPESVLLKPDKLTEDEFALIREHPDAGARILETIPFLDDIVNIVRYHHERWDGTGYPEGLSGEQIPYLARVLAVADAFDAMTTDRPYRPAMPVEEARRELLSCAGTQFDPEIVQLFVRDGVPEVA